MVEVIGRVPEARQEGFQARMNAAMDRHEATLHRPGVRTGCLQNTCSR